MRTSRSRTLGLTTAMAAIALGAVAIPAHAANPVLTISAPTALALDPNAPVSDHGPAGTQVDLNIKLTGGTPSAMAVVEVDLSSLKGVAELPQTPYGCTVAGTTLTCGQVFLNNGEGRVSLQLAAAKGGTAGATGTLHATARQSAATASSDTKVTLGGTKLKWKEVPANHDLKPGGTWTPDLAVTNEGQLPASQLTFTFLGGMGLEVASKFSNCEYGTNDYGTAVVCTVNSPVAPGETVHLAPVKIGVDASAYISYLDVGAYSNAPGQDSWIRSNYHFQPAPAGSPRLTVGKPETAPAPNGALDLDPNGGQQNLEALVQNTADFAAFGAWAPDQAHKQGKLTVGMTSSGPASVFWRSGSDPAHVAVTLPKQVKVTAAPEQCRLANPAPSDSQVRYDCETSAFIKAGYKGSFDFTVEVDPAAGATAVVTLPSIGEDGRESGKPWDPNKGNDSVTVALGGKADGGVPTGPTTPAGDKPGTPSTTPAGTPVGGGTATASTHPGTASATPSTKSGGLASTGVSGIGPMVGGGIAAIALGGGLIALVARRRKAGAHQ
ncbi:hypothetical protein [Kitasatospora cinereorecta]|uniref:Peptidase n=1 Tax=Kitasatospora cinereorecta TaxID=285560 RepID=A0ABW0VPR2_9ACTN